MVDIIIPTYNNYAELKQCLLALSHQSVKKFEVWIAVDGSTDETLINLPQFILSLPYPVHILEHEDKKNHGRSATRNLALSYVKRPFLWLLDSDMLPEPNCLQNHLSLCLEYKNAISVGKIYYQNAERNLWAKYASIRGHAKYSHKELLPWNYFITANSLIPTEYFAQLKGFDTHIDRYGGEDMEFAYRMYLKFSPCFYKNDYAVCQTIQEKTLSQALVQLEEYGRTGLPYIYQKHKNMPKVYHLDKIEGHNKVKRKVYQFLTLPFFGKILKRIIHYLPFKISKYGINYLVISAIFKGYQEAQKSR